MMALPDLSEEQRAALARHGYDPDIAPSGRAGPPSRYLSAANVWIRPHVCQLDEIEIDGHELSDLFPEDAICIHCHLDLWSGDRER